MDNPKTLILLLAGSQGILLSIALILSSLKGRLPNIFLAVILIVCSVELLNSWAMSHGYHSEPNSFPFWLFGTYLAVPPALWLFVRFSTVAGLKWKNKYHFLFVPAYLEMTVEFISFYWFRTKEVSFAFTQEEPWLIFTEMVPLFWFIIVLILYGVRLQKIGILISTSPKTRSHRLKHLLLFGVFCCLAFLWTAEIFLWLPAFPITTSLLCLMLFTLGYMIYFQPSFYEYGVASNEKKGDANYPDYNDEKELERLNTLMEKDKIYCQPRLSLDDLAAQLKLPVRYVSYLINKNHGANFNHYLNVYRVEEMLKRMEKPEAQQKTLLGIALDCGFNSKSSFNHFFKTYTGETPSAFLSKIKTAPKS